MASSTPSESLTQSSASEFVCSRADIRVRLLSSGYSIVDASRGESDHRKYARAFYEDAEDFSDDMEDDGCKDLQLPALELTMEAAILQAGVFASGEAGDGDYSKAAKAGQALMKAAGITDEKFGEDPFGN